MSDTPRTGSSSSTAYRAMPSEQEPPGGTTPVADGTIAVASFAIAVAFGYLVVKRRRTELAHPVLFTLFAFFLAAHGVLHALDAFGLWPQHAQWNTGMKVASAGLAAAAAIALLRAIPSFLRLPSRAHLQQETMELERRVEARAASLVTANEELRRQIAQREAAEAEARRLNSQLETHLTELQSLFEMLPVGVAIATDANCTHIRSNKAFADILGLPLNTNASMSAPLGAPKNFRVLHDGRELRPDELPMQRALATNSTVRDFEETIVRNDGVTLELIANAIPIVDKEGRTRGGIATFQDITAHKHAETKRLEFERKLLQSQKLESIGVLAGGIAHDFNNLLTGVLGHTNFARSELARGVTNVDHLLAQVELSAQRAGELCRQLLAYAGKGRIVVRLIDLNVAVEQSFPLLKLSISKKVTLDLQLGAGLPPFRGDPTQLNQVLMNLVINASEAIGSGAGTVTIRTDRVTISPMDMLTLTSSQDMEPGAFVCLEVRDTGCGIAPETIGHIFEPFFTTKFVGRGLGLAAVIGIVHGHRGGIRVTSQQGVGTAFELYFPVAPAPSSRDTIPAATTPATRGKVLVVDDEPTVRSFASAALSAAGYAVVTATDGEDALTRIKHDPTAFDAVLLDLTMPKLDGEDTLMALRMLLPNLPVVLTSGHSEQTVAQRFVGRGLADFLPKPFMSEGLVASINAAVARSRTPAG